jgi:hypothetical protein
MMLLGIAKLEVSIIDVLAHVVTGTGGAIRGGATGMSGLRPGAVAPDGTVASLKSGVATSLGVSRGGGLPTKELVSVESVVMAREAGSVMVAVGLQMLKFVVVPYGVVIGSGRTRGGELTLGLAEDDDEDIVPSLIGDDIKPPVVGDDVKPPLIDDDIALPLASDDIAPPVMSAALAASALVGPMIPVVGHVRIPPRDVPGNGVKLPR